LFVDILGRLYPRL